MSVDTCYSVRSFVAQYGDYTAIDAWAYVRHLMDEGTDVQGAKELFFEYLHGQGNVFSVDILADAISELYEAGYIYADDDCADQLIVADIKELQSSAQYAFVRRAL